MPLYSVFSTANDIIYYLKNIVKYFLAKTFTKSGEIFIHLISALLSCFKSGLCYNIKEVLQKEEGVYEIHKHKGKG